MHQPDLFPCPQGQNPFLGQVHHRGVHIPPDANHGNRVETGQYAWIRDVPRMEYHVHTGKQTIAKVPKKTPPDPGPGKMGVGQDPNPVKPRGHSTIKTAAKEGFLKTIQGLEISSCIY